MVLARNRDDLEDRLIICRIAQNLIHRNQHFLSSYLLARNHKLDNEIALIHAVAGVCLMSPIM